MTPLYSYDDRARAIRKFIYARSKKLAGINSYSRITDCLEEERVKPLCKLEKTGSYRDYGVTHYYYTDKDAITYFEWLISVVLGTRDVSDDIAKKAIDQLFLFIFALDGTLSSDAKASLLEPYSLSDEIIDIEDKIEQVQKKVNRMDDQIVDALEKIIDWQQKYQPYLDKMVKDQESIENAFRGKGKDKK